MTCQIETTATTAEELDTEALDLVVGGLSCRKAGGDQTDYLAPDPKGIIVVC